MRTRSSTKPGSPELMAFVTSAAIVAVNIVVASLVVVRPGARLADHVYEVAVPLAILAAASLLYPRLRPGVRGAMALFVGVLALTGAGLVVAEAAQTGFRAVHVVGFFLIAAGATFIWLGGSALIRSRKPGRLRYARRAAWVVVTLLAAYWVVLPLGMAAYATHRPQTPAPRLTAGIEYEDVTLETSDGIRLEGWYIPSKNGAAVVTYPREWTVTHAAMLAEQGYGVLLLDMRGYGASEGDPNALGWGCAKDIDAGVAYLQTRQDVTAGRIGGLGLSVGAEQMIEAAAANPGIQGVVAEGAGERSVRESLIRGAKGYFALPMAATRTAAVAMFSGQLAPPALDDLAARISPRGLFLIHAENGGGGEDLTPDYYAAAGEPKSLWMVPGGAHTGGLAERPQEYAQKVGMFFAQALLQ